MVAWSCDDDRRVLELYFEAGRKPLPQSDDRVVKLAEDIGHPAKAVHMKMANYQWFDRKRIGGLEGGSKQSWVVWCEQSPGMNPPRLGNHRYSRCDDIMILDLYFKAGRQPLPERDLRVLELSGIIDTSPKSVHRRLATYQWHDPERQGGLDTTTSLTTEVWNEFSSDEQKLEKSAADIRRKFRQR